MDVGFTNLLIIVAVGFAAPLALGFAPAIRLPSVVVEIVAGIVVGPAVLGWVSVDEPVRVFAWPTCCSSPASRSISIASADASFGWR
jgi:Kef-type K+ transport system membrane component KefB